MTLAHHFLRRMIRLLSVVGGPVLLAGGMLIYAASFRLPSGRIMPGLDPAIWLAADVYREHGLEFGRDIVHVFGPLGRLMYPVAGNGRLMQACWVAVCLHAMLLAGLCAHAIARRRYVAVTGILLISALFLFENPNLREAKVYTVCLVLWMLDLLSPRRGIGLIPAAVSAVFVFAKFNMALTLVPLMLLQIGIAWVGRLQRWWCAAKLAVFTVVATAIAASSFSSWQSIWWWVRRSMDIAAGNSEAMSNVCPEGSVAVALVVICVTVALGLASPRGARREGLAWLVLVSVPVFVEFKHGFVRAGPHVTAFFSFLPVVAATRLLGRPSRPIAALVGLSVVLNAVGPGLSGRPFTVERWLRGPRWEGIRIMVSGKTFEARQAQWSRSALEAAALTPSELAAIGDATVEFVPSDITPLFGTSLRWRPSPFFQHILIRSLNADSVNARHTMGPLAAERLVVGWETIDSVHPFDRCPLTFRALLASYRPITLERDRLLLERSPPRRVDLIPLGSARVRWMSNCAIPQSSQMVFAAVRTHRTAMGRIMRALYRTPPVYIRFEDGSRRRFVPATAPHGLVVSRQPLSLGHLRHLMEHGSPPPGCLPHRTMRLVPPSRVKHFADEVQVEFFELSIKPNE